MIVTAATPALADLWYEHYEKGEDALSREDWQEAIQQFTLAIEKKGDPGVRVRTYGMNFVNYHPYLKLGIAYFHLERYDAALQAFDTEERLGAIEKSTADRQTLTDYRGRIEAARRATQDEEQERIADLVSRSLGDARTLRGQGRLEDAIAAVGRGLSVDPDNTEANALLQELQDQVSERQRIADRDARLAQLLESGRSLLSAGSYQEAASAFNQALSEKPGDREIQGLLTDAQTRLRNQVREAQDAEERRTRVQAALRSAANFEQDGNLEAALNDLQIVLALDPGNAQASSLQTRILQAQGKAEALKARSEEVAKILGEARAFFEAGDFERALGGFNRALALEPANPTAMAFVQRAYREMNAGLLRGGVVTNLPPALLLNDLRSWEDDNETEEERTSSSVLAFSGTVVDTELPITLRFSIGQGTLGQSLEERTGETERREPAEILNFVVAEEQVVDTGTNLNGTYVAPFQTRLPLEPGVSTLQVVAEDASGLKSTSYYQVSYLQPFYLAPWFIPAALSAPVLGIGWFLLHRSRRRRQLRRRKFNPYVAGAPVLSEDLFLGREALLSRILQTVHNNSILLYGERRIGKTSLQHHLRKRLQNMDDPDYQFYPVYIDLQGTPEDRFFAVLAHDILTELAPLLEGEGLREEVPEGETYGYRDFIRDVRAVLKVLKKRSTKKTKLVLLIDEVDELNNYDPKINQRLRSLFMKSFAEDMVTVVSGVGIKKHWESEGSPWYNFFEEIEVRGFTREDAADLISRPLKGVFTLEKGAVDRIIESTDCKPYLIQKVCISLVDRMHNEKRRRITVGDVETAARSVEG